MVEALFFVVGALFGIIVTQLWQSARDRWQAARGMMKAPDKAKNEGREKIQKARAAAAKGRMELVRATLLFILLVLVALAVGWLLMFALT